jgi:dienelactone hydrolase
MSSVHEQRELLYSLMGDLPERDAPISCSVVRVEERETYRLESLVLEWPDGDPVPAYFIRPLKGDGPYPTMLYNHWHGGEYHVGKEQLLQPITGSVCPAWGETFIEAGYAALAIDHWCFGERRCHWEHEQDIFKHMLWQGKVLWGMMVYDSLRAMDYLVSRDDVDSSRIGTLGMSMGSTMAWWLAALDERVKVCVDICCLTDFDELIRTRKLEAHGIYYYVPSLLKYFSTTEINKLVAPRPHLALAGNYDHLTPPHGLDVIDAGLKEAYTAAGAPEAWRLSRYNVGHVLTQAMYKEAVDWLAEWL